jgi:PHP family Zn ribbon phosphoesterase
MGTYQSVDAIAVDYFDALQRADLSALTRVLGEYFACWGCNRSFRLSESWAVRRNNDLVCPACGETWVRKGVSYRKGSEMIYMP